MSDLLLKVLQQSRVILFLPLVVGPCDTLLHLVKRVLQHLSEVVAHGIDRLLQLSDLSIFLCLHLLFLIFQLFDGVLSLRDLVLQFILPLIQDIDSCT